MTKTRPWEDFEGQVVAGLGGEAALVLAHTETRPDRLPYNDTYINFRTGRLFGGVGASTYKNSRSPAAQEAGRRGLVHDEERPSRRSEASTRAMLRSTASW